MYLTPIDFNKICICYFARYDSDRQVSQVTQEVTEEAILQFEVKMKQTNKNTLM